MALANGSEAAENVRRFKYLYEAEHYGDPFNILIMPESEGIASQVPTRLYLGRDG